MGICDLIPGISGGTVAFITGIYARLIDAVKAFSLKFFKNLLLYPFNKNGELKGDIRRLDLGFLLILFLGIATSILLGSRLIKFLLDNHIAYTLAFFVGLILASSQILFTHIKNHKPFNMFFGLIGFLVGLSFIFLIPASVSPSSWYIFLGGFVAISAMFLPGISGSFILLIMGLYEFMINALHDLGANLRTVGLFGLGAVCGAFVISRVISFLFRKDKCKTIYFLLGLVIGALSIPIGKIVQSSPENYFLIVTYFLLGVIFILLVGKYSKRIIA